MESKNSATFFDIPYRVVIFRILPFHIFYSHKHLDSNGELREMEMYAYFKRDPTRKPFLLFRNVFLGFHEQNNERMKSFPKCLSIGELHDLRLHNLNPLVNINLRVGVHNFFKNALNFQKMKKLDFGIIMFDIFTEIKQLSLPKDTKFPVLESLDLVISENSKVVEENAFWCLTKQQKLWNFGNLRKIRFYGINLPLKTVIEVPQMEEIHLTLTKNVIFKPGKTKPVHYDLTTDVEDMRSHFDLANIFGEISLSPSSTVNSVNDNDFEFLGSLNTRNRQKTLTKMSLSGITFPKYKKFLLNDQNLEMLSISNPKNLDLHFFENYEFPKLKTLGIDSFDFCGYFTYPFFYHLEELYIGEMDVDDKIFQMNDWTCLKVLFIVTSSKTSGEKWREMPNLEEIDFEELNNFEDSFFRTNEFPKLKKFNVCNLPKLTGVGWNPSFLQNIERLGIRNCENFGDTFFQENEFPSLLNLHVYGHYTYLGSLDLKGKDWNVFPKLLHFHLSSCYVGDEIFQENDEQKSRFPELKYLYITRCKYINEEKWCEMSNMKRKSVRDCGGSKKRKMN